MMSATALSSSLNSALVVAVEVSRTAWVIAAHVPGLSHTKVKQRIEPRGEALLVALERLKRRAARTKTALERIVVAYEAGYSGFWLARLLRQSAIEVFIIQPVSVPVDRRSRRAKTDAIDAELLLRTCLAFLRGEPRVCSMVPIPEEAEEDARHLGREREDLMAERIALTNRIGAILATLGIEGYQPLRRDRREQVEQARTALDTPIPQNAKARILRLIDRLELVLNQLQAVESCRDAILQREDASGPAEVMMKRLIDLRGIGAQTATVLVREGFVRPFRSAKALGSYAGLVGTPFASGGFYHEQGITKAGNRRLRTAVVELAWLWLRYQPDSTLSRWFAERLGRAGGRMRKVLIVALARKLLIALWRYAVQGVVPDGSRLKPA
jgi:transposase